MLDESLLSFMALRPVSKGLTLSRSPAEVRVTGDLPPGLQLLSTGMLQGRATRSGWWLVELTTTTAAGQTSRLMTITVAPPCLPDWLAAHRLTGSALTSDADKDGLPLLVEFALGGDPAKPDPHFVPRLVVAGDRVSWEFPRGHYDQLALRVGMEYSPDMSPWSWMRCGCSQDVDASGLPVHTGTLHGQTTGGQGFFRIRVEIYRD